MVEPGDVVMHVADRQLPHDRRDHGTVTEVDGPYWDDLATVAWPGGHDKHPKANLIKCSGCPLTLGL